MCPNWLYNTLLFQNLLNTEIGICLNILVLQILSENFISSYSCTEQKSKVQELWYRDAPTVIIYVI
jgi:hypothetical protein